MAYPALTRTRPGLAPLAFLALLGGCGDAATDGIGHGRAALAVTPIFPEGHVTGSLNLVVDQVKVRVIRPPSDWVVDTSAVFPTNASAMTMRVQVPLKARTERMEVVLELWAGPQLAFAGSRAVDVAEGAGGPPTTVPLTYRGPGADARTIRITPRDTVLLPGDTLRFRIEADNGNGQPVPHVYVNWSTGGNSAASITPAGLLTAAPLRGSVMLHARAGSGARDSTRIWFAPAPNVLALLSGAGQSAQVGTELPEPLVVQALAPDGLAVAGTTVRFIASSRTGRTIPSEVRTNENGIAMVRAVLGTEAGPQYFIGTIAGTPATVQFLMEGLPATPGGLMIVGGADQIVGLGEPAPLPLEVRVVDRFDNPVPGVPVRWEVLDGEGVLGVEESTSDATGVARITYRMGTRLTTNLVRASLPGAGVSVIFGIYPVQ